MERYFEFFIKTILRTSQSDFNQIDKIWNKISNQSERQLGAYIVLYSDKFVEVPLLLDNKEVGFRNKVIHKGKIPTELEAIDFGNKVMKIVETSLIKLKTSLPEATNETFDRYGYQRNGKKRISEIEKETGEEQVCITVNIMTTISVKYGREVNKDDKRKGHIEDRIPDILEMRNPRRLRLIKDRPK